MKKILSFLLILSVLCLSSPAWSGDITATGMNQGDLYNLLYNVKTALLNRSNSAPEVAISATPANVKTTNALQYTVGGYNYTVSADADITGLSAAEQAANTYCMYLLSINSSGTFAITKGAEVATDTAILPELPSSSAPVGAIKVATGATPYTFGTTDLDEAWVTDTYYDIGTMPSGSSRVGMTGW